MGYGHSLGPQLCSLARRSIVTLHEFSLGHPLRKLSLLPFTLLSPRIVMTSEFEKRSLTRMMPWAEARIRIIPNGSNIQLPKQVLEIGQERIAYYGLIMPRKGLESFIELSKLIRVNSLDWELVVIGRIPPAHAAYAKSLMESGLPYGVRWILDRSPEDVSELLSCGGLAYLPFPDGASERRGSLKTTLAAGLPTITTQTEQTPSDLIKAVAFAVNPLEAFQLARRLMASKEERRRLSHAALEYSGNFSWDKIAKCHIEMYNEIGKGRRE
jgi:glycosyltransferase involved in cell wall biosynthesis